MNILWTVVLVQITVITSDQLWKKVQVNRVMIVLSTIRVINPSAAVVKYTYAARVVCGSSCDWLKWCNTWCYDQSNGICIQTNILVSPLYVTSSTNTYTCYTHEEEDFIVGSSVTAPPTHTLVPTRVASNLVRGIYNFNEAMTCCQVANIDNPWILFELKSPQIIHEIRVTTQCYNYSPELPTSAQIRVGMSPPVAYGNFTNLSLFGTLPATIQSLETYSLKNAMAINVQYIAIQKPIPGILVICQVIAL